MTDMPPLAVVLMTYVPPGRPERHAYAMESWRAAIQNLRYAGAVTWFISDDGSEPEHGRALHEYASMGNQRACVLLPHEHGGYGASYNLATQVVHVTHRYILMLEDDWRLTRELDVTPYVQLLADHKADCVRMGYLGLTQDFHATISPNPSGVLFMYLEPASPERHVFAGHPRIETREFQRRVGPWPEGLSAGDTEFEVSGRAESRNNVVWPLDIPATGGLWAHIGTVASDR